MTEASRRQFLRASAAISTAASARRALGANDRIRIAVVGTGGRGQYLMKTLKAVVPKAAQFVAVCDVYDVRRGEAAKIAGEPVEQYLDYKQILTRKDVDAVIVATPDHWHAPIAVDAMNSGKDVYIEKPMVHFPADGQAIVKAARANKRVVQVGTQGRGMTQNIEAREKYVQTGIMGKVGFARTWYLSNQGYVKTPPPGMEKKPDGLDWERWLGRGPKVAWNPDVYFSPYKWLHYDGGMIMGIGIHVIDTAHFMLGLGKPKAAVAGGGVYFYKDGRDTPDTVSLIIDYPQEVTATFTAEALTAPGVKTSAGVELSGTGGKLYVERYSAKGCLEYTPNGKYSQAAAAKSDGSTPTAAPMLVNWIECVRSRKKTIANEVEAYWSTMACFMGNLAFQKRTRIVWDNKWDLPA